MTSDKPIASDLAFTAAVKAIQTRKGSRESFSKMREGNDWETSITLDLAEFVAAQTSVFLGTANNNGQPYIQHRGGPAGFLHVLDNKTIAFADFRGNRQFITLGNLAENPKAFLFLIDYSTRRRIKIWGTARVVEGEPALITKLMPVDYKARAEHAIVFSVATWDENCSQHILQRFDADDVARVIEQRDLRIAELEAEVAQLGKMLNLRRS